MTILFPSVSVFDIDRDVISFRADVNGQQIRCAISQEALEDHFGDDDAAPQRAFSANLNTIERIAARLITAKRFEPDGSILIRSQDC